MIKKLLLVFLIGSIIYIAINNAILLKEFNKVGGANSDKISKTVGKNRKVFKRIDYLVNEKEGGKNNLTIDEESETYINEDVNEKAVEQKIIEEKIVASKYKKVEENKITKKEEASKTNESEMFKQRDKGLKNNKYKMAVGLEGEKNLNIYSIFQNNKLLLTKFAKKEWGTWNIDGWYIDLLDEMQLEEFKLIAGGGSDWEYVFRVTEDENLLNYEFSGGNHGNEIMEEIKFIDSETQKELDFKKNQVEYINKLEIIENTYLTIQNNREQKYAKVIRKYIVDSNEIKLKTTFEFVDNIYMGTSYVCMFPISKTYGKHIVFEESGNEYATPSFGATKSTATFENFIGKEATKSVEISNKDSMNYTFEVAIGSSEMTNLFSNKLKVFYWDMNSMGNKLYFSKYDNDKPVLVMKDTRWENESRWEIK
jgi:hypothetical protein